MPLNSSSLPRRDGRTLAIALAGLAAALAVAAYLNTRHNPFVFDDFREIVDNPSIASLSDVGSVLASYPTRPLTNLSYALDFAVSGLDPSAYHTTNILLHAFNVFLLFVLISRLFEQLSPEPEMRSGSMPALAAFTGAGLFAVHPLLTGAVGYISARAELLAATCVLASFTCLHRALFTDRQAPSVPAAVAGAVLFLLALSAKETAVMLPAVLLVFDLLRGKDDPHWRGRALRLHGPLLALMAVAAAVRVIFYVGNEQASTASWQWSNVVLNVHVFERYLSLLCFPASLSLVPQVAPFHSAFEPRMLRAYAAAALVVIIAVLGRRRHPMIGFGICWFCLFLVPSAMIIILAPIGQPMAEHRVYLASCGFFMAVSAIAWSLPAVWHQRSTVRTATAVVAITTILGGLAAVTARRNQIWSDPVLLWADAAQKAPRTWSAQYGAAEAHRTRGACDRALPYYERAIALRPAESAAYLGLSDCLLTAGRAVEARVHLRRAVENNPTDVQPRLQLATIESTFFRDVNAALEICRDVLLISPHNEEARACMQRHRPATPASRRHPGM